MKGIIILVTLVLIAGLLGWVTSNNSGDTVTVSIDKQEVQRDTEAAVEKVKEVAEEAKDTLQKAVDGDESAAVEPEMQTLPTPPIENPATSKP